MAQALALFDFDGTVTTHDTLIAFIRYAKGERAFWQGMVRLAPMLTAYKLKLIANDTAKAHMLTYFFGGTDAEVFKDKARTFSLERIDTMVRPAARERIAWHQARGDEVVVVTASMACWVEPWCAQAGIRVLATRMEVRQGRISGNFATPNCYGEEKVARIRRELPLDAYETIYAYGDSAGDKPMLALAHHAFFKPFRS